MEQNPFNLDEALRNWREQMLAMGIADDTIEELETHLSESTASLEADGLSAAESFHIAVSRLGEMGELAQPQPRQVPISVGKASRVWLLLLLAGGVLIMGGVISCILGFSAPKMYSAQATIQIARSGDGGGARKLSPSSLPSEGSLRQVVADLDLLMVWDIDEAGALQRLRERVVAQPMRGTDLVHIQVVDTDPGMAPILANAIARRFQTEAGGADKVVIHEMAEEDAANPATLHQMWYAIGVLAGALGILLVLAGSVLVIVQRSRCR